MRLRRIEIAHFRKLTGPVVLDGLGDGLVVIAGDNEEGKSTILAALKAAFFEHHQTGGAVREAMAPLRGGVPEIAVEFEIGGEMLRLRKAFRRGGLLLETPTQRLQDDAAERRLQELLRFERRQARTPRPENAGLQALFWVDQATTFQGFEAIAGGRERLAAAIAAEIGTVAGGERSRRLLAVAQERAAAFFTASRQQETGALRAAAEQLRALETEHATLEARRSEFDYRVDRLARLRDGRRRLIEQDAARRARGRCEALRRSLGELGELERRSELAVEALKAVAAERAQIEAQQRGRGQLIADEAQLAGGRQELAARLAAIEDELEMLRHGEAVARRAEGVAADALAAAERCAAAARGWARVAQLDAGAERLRAALARCVEAGDAGLRTQAALASNLATPERVAAVRARQREYETAAAHVAAAATRLEFHGDAGMPVVMGGLAVDQATPLLLTERAELTLGGFGRLVVVPGGEELGRRQETQRTAAAAFLRAALTAAGATSLAEAEAALERRRVAEVELARADADRKGVLQAFATDSVEALAQLLANQGAECSALRERLAPLDGGGDADALAREVAQRADALAQARAALEAAREVQARAVTEAARLKGEQTAAGLRATELHERLAVARKIQTDEALAVALAGAVERHGAAQDQHERIGRELQAGDGEGLRERLAMAERELADLDGERLRLDAEIRDLEVALREAGAGSWLERLGEVEVTLAGLRAEHARLELEGRAWKLLAERLAAADQSLRERLVEPIGQRLRPLLQRVFPGADPVFDPEALRLTHLRRDGVEEAYGSLSVGAREQLAVLVRLAFASLLAEREGEAPCLILDDALVYADETRFEAMKAILQRVARDMQIIVLTCRPRDYYGLDARYLRLEDCRVG